MLGVGVVGAGPGAWALHIPTIARLPDLFSVVHVSDAGSGEAHDLADALGARSSTGIADLLADPAVDVVAICSPPPAHAAHVRAAVEAGVAGILCEKPIALDADEAVEVVELCRDAGIPLIVGSHHLYDPAWQRAKHHLLTAGGELRRVDVSMSLPPNDRYHAVVTDRRARAAARPPAPDWSDPAQAADAVRRLVSGLLVHDFPLLRDLVAGAPVVDFIAPLRPIGVALGWHVGEVALHSAAVLHGPGADALWRLSIITTRERVEIDFPPSFVHGGSARVRVRGDDGAVTDYPREVEDGYEGEWRALAKMIDGTHPVEYQELIADVRYALALAGAAAELIAAAGAGELA